MRFRYLPPTDQWCSPKDKTPEEEIEL